MTSACIFKDTLRNDTRVFLKFRDSIFEVCLHLIKSNFTSYFLPSSMLSSGAGTSKEILFHESGLLLPAIPITFSFSFFKFGCSIKKFIQSRLLNSTWHLTLQSIRWILNQSLWNKSLTTPVHNGTTLRISWPRPNYCRRRLTQWECPQFLRLHPPNPNS